MAEDDYRAGDDKFLALKTNHLPEQIQWKLARAKQHFREFETQVASYMNVQPTGPGKMVHAPESTLERPRYIYATADPTPARFGLIAGDHLQNLRSVLDYVVWQLIVANGETPHKTKTAFPVCRSRQAFKDAKGRRLAGVPIEAIALIETMQPYSDRDHGTLPQSIHILDELTNENKHRQVLFTAIASIAKPEEPVPFPHIELEVSK